MLFPLDSDEQADHLLTQAMEWMRAGQLTAAQQLLERAAALNAEGGRAIPEGYARLALGRLRLELGDAAAAQDQLQQAATLLAAGGDRGGQVRLLFELGALAEEMGDQAGARARYGEILALEGEAADQALAHLRLGALWRDQGGLEAAQPHYEAARTLFGETGNELGEARAVLELGRLVQDSDPGRARTLFGEGLALAELYGQDELAAVAHLGLGGVALDRREAQAHYTQARDLAADVGYGEMVVQAEAALQALAGGRG